MPSGLPRSFSPLTRSLAGAVALTLTTSVYAGTEVTPLPSVSLSMRAGPEIPPSEIERLYVEGQEKYDNGEFAAAADAWTRLLNGLSESQANKATREMVLLNVLQADIDAYNRTRKGDGSKDVELLRSGKKTLDEYYTGFRRAYGDLAAVSAAVQEKGDELEQLLSDVDTAGDDSADDGPAEEDSGDDESGEDGADDGPLPPPPPPQPSDAGTGLIIGGAVAGSIGVGMLGLGIAGAIIGPQAEDDFNNATDSDEEDAATARGQRANAMMISGLAISLVGLGVGAALIVIGLKKKKQASSTGFGIAPVVAPRFAGAALSAKF